MHAVKETKNPKIIDLLLDYEADIWVEDIEFNTVIDYVKNNKHMKNKDTYWRLEEAKYE